MSASGIPGRVPWSCGSGRAALFAECTLCGPRLLPGLRASPICRAPCSRCWRFWPISAAAGVSGPRGSRVALVSSWVLLAAATALLSKAVAVSVPLVLLILDVYPLRRLGGGPGRWFGPSARKVWCEKVPFFLLSLEFMGVAIAAKALALRSRRFSMPSFSARNIAHACYGIWFYLVKTVLPLEITAYYPLPERIDWFAPPFLPAILGTLVVSVALFLLRRRRPGLLAAWLSYLIILAPNSGLVRIGDLLGADRYSYLAMLGGVMVAAAPVSVRSRETSWHAADRVPSGAIRDLPRGYCGV